MPTKKPANSVQSIETLIDESSHISKNLENSCGHENATKIDKNLTYKFVGISNHYLQIMYKNK